MGMSYRQFWEEDSTLVIAYRKAQELKNEQRNTEMWLQGLYIYEALCCVAPVMNAFAKTGTRPRKYSEKPYIFKGSVMEKREQEQKINRQMAKMEEYMAIFNKRFADQKRKEVSET